MFDLFSAGVFETPGTTDQSRRAITRERQASGAHLISMSPPGIFRHGYILAVLVSVSPGNEIVALLVSGLTAGASAAAASPHPVQHEPPPGAPPACLRGR